MRTYKNENTPGEVILTRRNDLGMTQVELVEALSRRDGKEIKSANFITIMEKGRSQVPLERAPALARVLEMDGKWFAHMLLKYRYPEFYDLLFKDGE